jgi:predicted CoA-binding protein
VYIAGDVTDWKSGEVQKRSGRKVSGVQVDYKQTRSGYHRKEFVPQRDHTTYNVKPTTVKGSSQQFRQIIEVPKNAQNVHFYTNAKKLPKKYQSTLQNVR